MKSIRESGLDWLLYTNSPFLLPIVDTTIKATIELARNINHHPAFAISAQVASFGTIASDMHQRDFAWLAYTFNLTNKDLTDYLCGFTTPSLLILGGFLRLFLPMPDVLTRLNPPTTDPILQAMHKYKAELLPEACPLIGNTQGRTVNSICEPVYDLCLAHPQVPTDYFYAGVYAAWHTSCELTKAVDL